MPRPTVITEHLPEKPQATPREYIPLSDPVRVTDQQWPQGIRPVVSICCIAFNHGAFIREAIEGFLMQETTFPVEILVHDDASTDDTASIIQEYEQKYPQLLKPIYQTVNQYSRGKRPGRITRERSQGDFVAFCEGDDCWTDPQKLQSQVEFLQRNPHFVGSCHAAVYRDVDASGLAVREVVRGWRRNCVTLQDLIAANPITTCTVVIRRRFSLIEVPSTFESLPFRDLPQWAFATMHGPIGFSDRSMAVYRRHRNGAWTGLSDAVASQSLADYSGIMARYLDGRHRKIALSSAGRSFGNALFHAIMQGDSGFTQQLIEKILAFPWHECTAARGEFGKRLAEQISQNHEQLDADFHVKLRGVIDRLLDAENVGPSLRGPFGRLAYHVVMLRAAQQFKKKQFKAARRLYMRSARIADPWRGTAAYLLGIASFIGVPAWVVWKCYRRFLWTFR